MSAMYQSSFAGGGTTGAGARNFGSPQKTSAP